ncbi:MAG: flagellar export protein FliJ [Rubrivivax sp.]|nr:flagellar export protein FliJ [Rubrivivax sp.]
MSTSLHALLSHAENLRDETLSQLAQAESHQRQLERQATQLAGYRDDYRARHPATGGRSASIELLRVHQGFMLRLDQALAQLEGQQTQAAARLEALRRQLLAQETRVASVRKLLERRTQEAELANSRREQRRTDDATAQRHRSARLRGNNDLMPLLH